MRRLLRGLAHTAWLIASLAVGPRVPESFSEGPWRRVTSS